MGGVLAVCCHCLYDVAPAAHRPRSMRYAKDPQTDRSLRHSIRDGMAYAVMAGGGETYFSAFALFLRASAPQVALLSTLPALLGSLAQLLSAWLGRRLGRRRPVVLAGTALQALTWLPLLLLPLWYRDAAVGLLLIIVTVYFAGANLAAPQWTSLMGDLVPERRRGRFFARRTRLTAITTFVALAGAGTTLHLCDVRQATATGFVIVFTVAMVARWISVYHLACMHEPSPHGADIQPAPDRTWFKAVRGTGALWFSLYFVLMQSAVAIAGPFFAVYMLRDLQFSYLQFMLTTGTAVLVQFLTLTMWGRISDVFGNRLILRVTGIMVPLLPLLWIVSTHFGYLLVLQCLSGFAWAGLSLSAGNLLFDLVPARQRATYAAFHNVSAALGIFVGGMFGAALVLALPPMAPLLGQTHIASSLLSVFVVSSTIRALVAVLLVRRVRELRRPRKAMSTRMFIFRATRFNALVGVMYELVTLFRPQPPAGDIRADSPGQASADESK